MVFWLALALAVFYVPPAVAGSTPCAPVSLGLADWWSAEGNANDNVGTNNGTLVGGASYAPGEVGQAFSFDGVSGYVSIPDSPSLDSFVTNMTIETWIKVNQTNVNSDWRGIVTKGNDSWRLQGVQGEGTVSFAANGLSTYLTGTRNVNDEQWHHVAGVYDGTNIYLYVDGTLDTSTPATGLIIQDSFPVCLGANPDAPLPYYFNGLIDEVSIYNRALSAAEIQSIYLAGSEGKCPMPLAITTQPTNETGNAGSTALLAVTANGMQPLNYQWNFNGTNLTWATNNVLTLTNVQPANGGVYAVTVTNLYGSVTSSNAVLTVLTQPPTIATQPTNETVNAGSPATLAVVATGTAPLSYQWSFNGTNLVQATNNVLTLTNIQPTNGGTYAVTVTNLYGSAASSNALLTVLTQPPIITTQPVSQTNLVDATVTFSVTAAGTTPLSYQWSFNATNIPWATNSSLVRANVQLAQMGDYSVLVSNAYGTTNSAIAVLTVLSEQSCDPPPSGLVSWWAGNGNANDIIGTNNGTWKGTPTYTNGEVGQAFSVNTINCISIPDSPSLDQFTTAFTLEFWEKGPSPNNNWNCMVSKSDSGYEIRLYDNQNYANFYVNGLSNDVNNGVVGTRNVNDGKWHHIAGVYDGTNCYLYVDGTLDAKQA